MALEADVCERHVHVVDFAQVERGASQIAFHLRIAETGADAQVVFDEVAERRVDRKDAAAEVDPVEDQHVVGIVARQGAVRNGDTGRHLAFVDELDFVDLPVDATTGG